MRWRFLSKSTFEHGGSEADRLTGPVGWRAVLSME